MATINNYKDPKNNYHIAGNFQIAFNFKFSKLPSNTYYKLEWQIQVCIQLYRAISKFNSSKISSGRNFAPARISHYLVW